MALLTDILGRGESAGTAGEDIIPYLGTLLPWGSDFNVLSSMCMQHVYA